MTGITYKECKVGWQGCDLIFRRVRVRGNSARRIETNDRSADAVVTEWTFVSIRC